MAKYTIEQNGQRFDVDVPDGMSLQEVSKSLQDHFKKEPTFSENFEAGVANMTTGGTQLLEHIVGKENFDAANKWLETHLPDITIGQPEAKGGGLFGNRVDPVQQSDEDFDEYVKRRAAFNEKRGTGGVGQLAGEITATLPLAPAKLLAARPLVGAGVLGGTSGALEPVLNPEQGFFGQKATQTGVGALEGVALGQVGKTIGGAVNKGAEALAKKFALPNIQKIIDRGKLPTPGSRTRAQNSLTDVVAKSEIAKRMASDTKGGGLSQQQLLALVREANAHGIPMTMADFADPELAGLIGNLARVPGPARTRLRKFLENRDIKEGRYLTQMVRRMMTGGSDASAYRTAETLIKKQAADAAPLYDLVAKHPGVEISDALGVMLETDALKGALRPGIEFETNMAASEGKKFDPQALGITKDKAGNYGMPAKPQLRVLDIAKKGLDAMIGAERDVNGRLSQRGLGLDRLRRAFIAEIDRLDNTGVYKRARDAWAGPAASLDAIELGQKVFKHNPEEFADLMGDMSEANRDFVRIGAADEMIKKLNQVGLHGDEAKALVRSSWTRQQIEPLFRSTAGYNAFINEIDMAVRRFETKRKYMGGSQTAERLAEDTSGAISKMATLAHVARELVAQNPLGAVRHMYRYLRDVGIQPDEKLNDAIAKIVTTADEAGTKRHAVPARFNLSRLKKPFGDTGRANQALNRLFNNAGPELTRIINQITVPAAASNQPQDVQ